MSVDSTNEPRGYTVRLLGVEDVAAFVAHAQAHDRESGRAGDLPYGPYGRGDGLPAEEIRARALRRWQTPVGKAGWRRCWGLWHGSQVVGHVYLAGADLPAQRHRVDLGLGIQRPHRGEGYGRGLMRRALEWARDEPGIEWVDLGVFAGNDVAYRLYQNLGFEVTGRTGDLYRVDGRSIDNIQMTLFVGAAERPRSGS